MAQACQIVSEVYLATEPSSLEFSLDLQYFESQQLQKEWFPLHFNSNCICKKARNILIGLTSSPCNLFDFVTEQDGSFVKYETKSQTLLKLSQPQNAQHKVLNVNNETQ